MSAPAYEIPGYELIRELGAGGMATVYLAVQRSLDRKVAIKIMRRGLADENVEKRFLMEGRTMARLPHPNIVGVYDIVQNDSINYIAMEFLEGGMLSDKMRDGLTLAEAVSVVVQVAGALQYAHDNGIVHRDLKPSNIMYRDALTPVLTDFGIAKQQNSEGATRLTQTGMMIGTPTYMSPEQATGSELDGRSDQYALGVLFFEMLTGRAPFEGSTPIQVVLAHLNSPPPPLPPQFAFFQPLMDRMLSKDREQRFPDLKIFVKELKSLLTGSDALLHKLQLDPNSSASEQLRALGFSESQIHTGAGQSPVSRVSAQRPAPNLARSTGSGPGVRMGGEPSRAAGRPPWLLPVAISAALAVVGVGGWLVFSGGQKDLDPATALLLNSELERVDRLIGEGKLVAPAGDNAFERLQVANQVALKSVERFPEGEKRLAVIAGLLREQANKALAGRKFVDAESRVGEALAVLPGDAETLKLQQAIVEAKLAVEREAKVGELLARASQAQRAGRMVGEGSDNALAAIRDALILDPNAKTAQAALAALITELLRPASSALQSGRLDSADESLQQVAAYLANEPAWQSLSKQLDEARAAQQQKAKVDGLVRLAQSQFKANRIAEPAGDNVLETLQRLSEVAGGEAQAAPLRQQAAALLLKQAEQAEKSKDYSLALARYDQVLQAAPGNTAASTARNALEQRVGEQQAQLSRALSTARDAIGARNFFAPADKNAYAALQQVLKLDPGNAQARQLLADLPKLSRDAAEAMAGEGQIDQAIELLKQAQAVYKNDAQIAVLASRLNTQLAQAAQGQQRERLLRELQAELAKRQLNPPTARAIGGSINALLKLDPRDADALRYREQFLRGVNAVIDNASQPAQLEALRPVLAEIGQQLDARSADVAALNKALQSRVEAVAAAEQERLAAISGTLVLNALPWANVESVVEQSSGKAVSLPGERSTPLRMVLPEGTYRITFKHPDVRSPVVQVASVKAKSTQASSASFPALSAADYLKRAGYAN